MRCVSMCIVQISGSGIRLSRVIETCKSGGIEITALTCVQLVMGSFLSKNLRFMERFQVAASIDVPVRVPVRYVAEDAKIGISNRRSV